ncbi:MAG: hypothetical protein RIQ87_6 [Chloroflexota bacterium]|jgi:hypothetical protein
MISNQRETPSGPLNAVASILINGGVLLSLAAWFTANIPARLGIESLALSEGSRNALTILVLGAPIAVVARLALMPARHLPQALGVQTVLASLSGVAALLTGWLALAFILAGGPGVTASATVSAPAVLRNLGLTALLSLMLLLGTRRAIAQAREAANTLSVSIAGFMLGLLPLVLLSSALNFVMQSFTVTPLDPYLYVDPVRFLTLAVLLVALIPALLFGGELVLELRRTVRAGSSRLLTFIAFFGIGSLSAVFVQMLVSELYATAVHCTPDSATCSSQPGRELVSLTVNAIATIAVVRRASREREHVAWVGPIFPALATAVATYSILPESLRGLPLIGALSITIGIALLWRGRLRSRRGASASAQRTRRRS